MKFKVYVDYTIEALPRPFYVGNGNASRVANFDRNRLHTSIKNKYGIDRRVVFETNVEEEVFSKEIALIAEYKTCIYDADSWGANFTRGGEGTSGMKHSDESKRKNSQSNKLSTSGEKNGMFGKHHSEETRKKIGDNQRGRIDSQETRLKKSLAAKKTSPGRILSCETKKKISEARKGKAPWNKDLKGVQIGHMRGKTHTEETKQKLADSHKGKIPWNKGLKGSQTAWNKGKKKEISVENQLDDNDVSTFIDLD